MTRVGAIGQTLRAGKDVLHWGLSEGDIMKTAGFAILALSALGLASCGPGGMPGTPQAQAMNACRTAAGAQAAVCDCLATNLSQEDFQFLGRVMATSQGPGTEAERAQRGQALVQEEMRGDPMAFMQRMTRIQQTIVNQCPQATGRMLPG